MPRKAANLNMYHQKHGLVMSYLVDAFLSMKIGDRMETIEEISTSLNVGRGTVQTALTRLKDQGVIKTESRGHLGTCVTSINYDKLLLLSGVQEIMGVMPVIRSKKLEGLAEGIRTSLSHMEGVKTEISFVHGAQKRIEALLNGNYDFAVMSHQAAKKHMKDVPSAISIVKVIGGASYIGRHVLVTHRDFVDDGSRAIRVGADFTSDDQTLMTMRYFQNKNIIIIPCQSNNLAEAIGENRIDCAIDNSDNNYSTYDYIKTIEITDHNETKENTETAIVVRADDHIMQRILKRNIDIPLIEKIQEEVMQKI